MNSKSAVLIFGQSKIRNSLTESLLLEELDEDKSDDQHLVDSFRTASTNVKPR